MSWFSNVFKDIPRKDAKAVAGDFVHDLAHAAQVGDKLIAAGRADEALKLLSAEDAWVEAVGSSHLPAINSVGSLMQFAVQLAISGGHINLVGNDEYSRYMALVREADASLAATPAPAA